MPDLRVQGLCPPALQCAGDGKYRNRVDPTL